MNSEKAVLSLPIALIVILLKLAVIILGAYLFVFGFFLLASYLSGSPDYLYAIMPLEHAGAKNIRFFLANNLLFATMIVMTLSLFTFGMNQVAKTLWRMIN